MNKQMMDTLLEQYVISGGVMMFILMPLSLIMLGAVLQGMIRLRRGRVLPGRLRRLAVQAREDNDKAREDLIAQLQRQISPLAQAVYLSRDRLVKMAAGREETQPIEAERIDEVVISEVEKTADRMDEGLGLLATIYTIAPLLGLMGTILGMMRAFYEFGIRQERSIEVLSIGIQQALVTTLWGLGIAILAFVAAQWLQSRIRRYERRDLPRAVYFILDSIDDNFNAKPSGKNSAGSPREIQGERLSIEEANSMVSAASTEGKGGA